MPGVASVSHCADSGAAVINNANVTSSFMLSPEVWCYALEAS
jgi:hypothetical protein